MSGDPRIEVKSICIIQRPNGDVLATKGIDDDGVIFYRLIGGGVEFCETSADALHREVKEELNTSIRDIELLDVVENIFEYKGEKGHQVMFLYHGKIDDQDTFALESFPILDAPGLEAHWVSLQGILDKSVRFYPKTDWKKYLT
jgi:ADP-ribose pyrophosphatase YjhB (NUDIX family)